ncbi:MAG: hypothetical protein WAW96_08425 [Alphaproteobacteria bacterium]
MLATLRTSAIVLLSFLGLASIAQADEHAYSLGSVWEISYIETKPGKFDDYMKFLSTTYAKEMDAQKAKGLVTSYKVLTVVDARDREPDIILMVEHPKFAAFDTSLEDQDAMTKAVFGSLPKSNQASVDRESIRTLRGGMLTQEVKIK